MNNKELRKKIVDIISHTEIPGIKKANHLFDTVVHDLRIILTKKVAEVIADTLVENS